MFMAGARCRRVGRGLRECSSFPSFFFFFVFPRNWEEGLTGE